MNNKITRLVLFAVVIVMSLSGSVQGEAEVLIPGETPQPDGIPDATPPAQYSEPISPLKQYFANAISIEIFFSDKISF